MGRRLINVAKFYVMQFGPGLASDTFMSVNDEVHLLPVAQTVRNLGVSFASNLKSSEQTDRVVERTRGVLMQRTSRRLTDATFLPSYCALVRPLIEYCSQAWAPILLGDINKIE